MWSLNEGDKKLEPLIFSNGKNQDDIVKEAVSAIKGGSKIIFIKGMCGTGKSAIALNIAKEVGRTSIVVPIKNLQNQYEADYTNKKYLLKENGQQLKIKVITGRNNHKCPFIQESSSQFTFKEEGNSNLSKFYDFIKNEIEQNSHEFNGDRDSSCDNKELPCKIEIKEKNIKRIKEYLKENRNVNLSNFSDIKKVRRLSIAPICPYWSPAVPSELNLGLKAEKRTYQGLNGVEYTIYQRKKGCGYYDQFNSYINSDVIIFNSQKYKIETVMNRKPKTEVEIIDECDEFLDSFSNSQTISVNRLNYAIGGLFTDNEKIQKEINQMMEITTELLSDKKIDFYSINKEIFELKKTKVIDILRPFLEQEIMKHIECDEENYAYHCEEVAKNFENFLDESYVSFYRDGRELFVRILTTSLEKKLRELIEKNNAIVLMSGTLHSENVLKNVFGLRDFKIIDAESKTPGTITEQKTGMEIDCSYSSFMNGNFTRKQYLLALNKCIETAKRPTLVHVNAFKDLPTENEAREFGLNVTTQEKLRNMQDEEDFGTEVKKFKKGEIEILYSTKCNRGVDFPGETCNSIILTRYPYPDVSSMFWKILKKNKPQHYNEFYMDKARREFLQRVYRGLRSKNDHVFLLSPDKRVFDRGLF